MIEAADVPAVTRIVDALRAGPRLVSVTQATVTTATDGRVTLTAALLSFYRP
ncbi:hypothetical protein QSU92_10040 [Microbacterium sp. ET2]|uniref:hypothetical protein n=1 Tax=Microbacterium albipurpureum TaxID=3050384 RepID=UPI00259CA524|nr:hypothetical protein [Microbacterium sp. ET2 (Ac-2212)]WJL94330.1 hypothetical protein QSU92_10040 [Microbacterium sp. ET2 (Ac-2212)]